MDKLLIFAFLLLAVALLTVLVMMPIGLGLYAVIRMSNHPKGRNLLFVLVLAIWIVFVLAMIGIAIEEDKGSSSIIPPVEQQELLLGVIQ